ncbi:MAG: transposase [Armatimonadota bacterium]
MSQRYRIHEREYPYFITSTIVYWLPVFSKNEYFQVLEDSLVYCSQKKGLNIHAYVLMPNHFHLICSQENGALSRVIADLKGFTSRKIIKMMHTDGRDVWIRAMRSAGGKQADYKFWQDEFHPEQVYSQKFFDQKLKYIHENPLRAGYVDDPSDWKHSSAKFYYQEVDPEIAIAPLTW